MASRAGGARPQAKTCPSWRGGGTFAIPGSRFYLPDSTRLIASGKVVGAPDNDPRRFVGFELELTERRLIRDGRLVHLEPRAFDTLAYLAGRPGRLVHKRELIEALWPGVAVTDNALTRCIAEIRKALADDARSPRYIQTVPRLGYRFVGEPTPARMRQKSTGTAGTRMNGLRERRRPAVPTWRYAFGIALIFLLAASTWLLRSGDESAGGEGAAAVAPPRSIAVLPFLNLSEDRGNSYLADGLSENLLDLLASIPDVKVVARSSSFAFRGRNVDARTIGEALGVAWLLEGSVQRENDRIRVTVQLIDATTGYHAWSERYDRQLTDIFALQDEIATAAAAVIGSELGTSPAARVPPSENLDAYWRYLIGREHLRGRAANWRTSAANAFSSAIALDEDFAAAHAGLAIAVAIEGSFTETGRAGLLQRATAAAERALELEPELAIAHAAMGLVHHIRGTSPAEAEGFLRRALELEPTLIEAHNWLAGVLSAAGRYREAREQREAALAIDPLNPVLLVNQSMMKRLHGDYDGAARAANKLLSIPHRPGGAYWQMAQTQASVGHLVAALDNHAKAARELEPPNRLFHIGAMAAVLARLGLPDDARLLLERLRALDPEFSTDYWNFNALVRSGQRAAAGRLVRDAVGQQPWMKPMANRLPVAIAMAALWRGDFERAIVILEPLRDSPEFLYLNRPDQIPGPTEGLQVLALAYQRAGRAAEGAELLEGMLQYIEDYEREVGGIAPGLRYEKAACLALLDKMERAADTLAAALDGGWNDYYRALHDIRWDAARETPWFKAAMSRAADDLADQRAQLTALESRGESLASLPE